MKVSFINIGCKVNFADISEISSRFRELGHEVVKFGEKSDIVLINTCTVTNTADADGRKYIRRARRDNPEAFIGVMGCYAQLKPGEIAEIEGVDAVFGTNEKFIIPQLIEKFEKKDTTEIFVKNFDGEAPFHTSSSTENNFRTRVTLKIQDGCDYRCTYCTIPQARGHSRSMPFDELERQLKKIDDEGKKEVILAGINLGDYKTPDGKKFADVVRLIEKINPGYRVRISSIEPNLLTDEILDMVADSKVFCPHFHIPLQSGSPEILKMMKRRYKAAKFEDLIYKVRERIPNCGLGVDVICGFPGETDGNFKETYSLLERLPVTYLHAFTYSRRDNTPAAFMEQIPGNIRKERTNILRELSEKKRSDFYWSQIGEVRRTIPETQSKTGLWSGWTDNYIRVKFNANGISDNKIMDIRLDSFKGSYCEGLLL